MQWHDVTLITLYARYDHYRRFVVVVARVAATVVVVMIVVAVITAEVDSRLARAAAGIAVAAFVVVVAAGSNQTESQVIETVVVDASPAGKAHSNSAEKADFHFGTELAAVAVDSNLVVV